MPRRSDGEFSTYSERYTRNFKMAHPKKWEYPEFMNNAGLKNQIQ